MKYFTVHTCTIKMNQYLQFQENWRRRVFSLGDFTWNDPVGILDIPISSPPEQVALVFKSQPSKPFVSSLVSGSSSPAHRPHAAESVSPSSRSMTSVMSRQYRKLGYSRGTHKILKRQYSLRTVNQYSGAWLRFSAYLRGYQEQRLMNPQF